MRLPNLEYAWRKRKSEIVGIRGVNYSDQIADGDLADSAGLSTRRFPYFATRRARPIVDGYKDVRAIYRYGDDILTVVGDKLYCNDKELCTTLQGEKQFVTINTKVVVFPDKLMLDMTSDPPIVRDMDASFETVGTDTKMEHNKLTIPTTPLSDKQALASEFLQNNDFNDGFWFRTYTNLGWDGTKYTGTDSVVWREIAGTGDKALRVGDILVPYFVSDSEAETVMRAQSWVSEGQYVAPPSKDDDYDHGRGYYLQVKGIYGNPTFVSNGRVVVGMRVTYNVFQFGKENPKMKDIFRGGDALTISGHPIPYNNKEIIVTTDVTDDALMFPDNTFVEATQYGEVTKETMDAINAFTESDSRSRIKFGAAYVSILRHENKYYYAKSASETDRGVIVREGQVLFKNKTDTYFVCDVDETIHQCHQTSDAGGDKTVTVTQHAVDPLRLTVTRAMPDMDYICEKDNRLWGVVNKQHNRVWDSDAQKWKEFNSRVIVSSSLGMPDDFYDYNGAYSGAYAVAVASEGDFTGICAHGDSILAWKEKKLCKVLGDYPANYQLHEYTVDGLQSGAHGTQVNISETLLYKGVNGVYAYAGGTPRLISQNFGERRYSAKSAGSDGERYYITLTDDSGAHLHSYDVQRGLWLRESGENAVGYVDLSVGFSALLADGKLRQMDAATDDKDLEWYAQFTPLYETIDGKKQYAKLLLRLELGEGANLRILERVDGGLWKQIGRITAGAKNPVTVPVPIARGDKMEFRFEGKGACTILGIERQFHLRSEV